MGFTLVVDDDGVSVTNGLIGGGESQSIMWFTWGTDEYWADDMSDAYCTTHAYVEGLDLQLTPGAEHPVQLTMDPGVESTTDCPSSGLSFGNPRVEEAMDADYVPVTPWTISFGGALTQSVFDWLSPEHREAEYLLIGARVSNALVPGDEAAGVYVLAHEVDADGNILFGSGLPADTVVRADGQGLIHAAYTLHLPWHVDFTE